MSGGAEIVGEVYEPTIDKPYRWQDWVAGPDVTCEDLLAFVNDKLLPHLKELHGDDGDPRNLVSEVFEETNNRMLPGVQVAWDNALLTMVSDTSPASRVNLVLTNPTFGGGIGARISPAGRVAATRPTAGGPK